MAASTHNFYLLLGVRRDVNQTDLKRAYRKLALEWHPDKNPDKFEDCAEKFKMISEAFATLQDPRSRKKYDESLNRSCRARNPIWCQSDKGSGLTHSRAVPRIGVRQCDDLLKFFFKNMKDALSNTPEYSEKRKRDNKPCLEKSKTLTDCNTTISKEYRLHFYKKRSERHRSSDYFSRRKHNSYDPTRVPPKHEEVKRTGECRNKHTDEVVADVTSNASKKASILKANRPRLSRTHSNLLASVIKVSKSGSHIDSAIKIDANNMSDSNDNCDKEEKYKFCKSQCSNKRLFSSYQNAPNHTYVGLKASRVASQSASTAEKVVKPCVSSSNDREKLIRLENMFKNNAAEKNRGIYSIATNKLVNRPLKDGYTKQMGNNFTKSKAYVSFPLDDPRIAPVSTHSDLLSEKHLSLRKSPRTIASTDFSNGLSCDINGQQINEAFDNIKPYNSELDEFYSNSQTGVSTSKVNSLYASASNGNLLHSQIKQYGQISSEIQIPQTKALRFKKNANCEQKKSTPNFSYPVHNIKMDYSQKKKSSNKWYFVLQNSKKIKGVSESRSRSETSTTGSEQDHDHEVCIKEATLARNEKERQSCSLYRLNHSTAQCANQQASNQFDFNDSLKHVVSNVRISEHSSNATIFSSTVKNYQRPVASSLSRKGAARIPSELDVGQSKKASNCKNPALLKMGIAKVGDKSAKSKTCESEQSSMYFEFPLRSTALKKTDISLASNEKILPPNEAQSAFENCSDTPVSNWDSSKYENSSQPTKLKPKLKSFFERHFSKLNDNAYLKSKNISKNASAQSTADYNDLKHKKKQGHQTQDLYVSTDGKSQSSNGVSLNKAKNYRSDFYVKSNLICGNRISFSPVIPKRIVQDVPKFVASKMKLKEMLVTPTVANFGFSGFIYHDLHRQMKLKTPDCRVCARGSERIKGTKKVLQGI